MKTIFVTFLNYAGVKYCFNTKDETIAVGDVLKSKEYDNPMQVVDVLPTCYKYVNTRTGDLTNEPKSTYCVPIKTLAIRYEDPDIIYAYKISN